MPPSAMIGVSLRRRGRGAVHDGGQLRHPDAGNDARGADGPRSDAHLHRIGTGLDEGEGGLGGRHIAGNHLYRVGKPLDVAYLLENAAGMAVGGIDDDRIDTGRDQRFGAGKAFRAGAGGSRRPQPAL